MQSEELKRKAIAFDDMSPDESVGAFGGSGQWVELCIVRDLRALESAMPDADPIRWTWEERRFSESDIWDDMYDDEPPAPHKHVRNIRPLYAAPPAPSVVVKARTPKLPPVGNELYEHYPAMSAQTHAEAVKDYARAAIASALSAQVQDVAGWLPADEAPRGTVALIRHRSGQIDYVYKTNNGEPFLETWRYAGTASHGQQAPWPEYYLPISALPVAPAKQEAGE